MSETAQSAAKPHRSFLMERMLNFSDGVFAIVLTLLAFDLRLPAGADDAHLASVAASMSGSLVAFALSFALVGVFWMVHAVTLRALASFDWVVAAVNIFFLFTITLTPFASGLVGKFGTQGMAWRFYCVTIVAISVGLCALIAVSHRDEPRILHEEHHGRLWRRLARAAIPGVSFAIGYGLSVAGLHGASSLCWLLVPPLMLGVWLTLHRRAAPAQPGAPDNAILSDG